MADHHSGTNGRRRMKQDVRDARECAMPCGGS